MTRISWKNWLLLKAVRLFARPRSLTKEPAKILVVATTALGDTLWATPSLHALREKFPLARITVLTSPVGKSVLEYNPAIDEILVLNKTLLRQFASLLFTLRQRRFDAAVIFHASQRLILPLCALSRIPRIIGTASLNKGLDALLTDAIANPLQHEIERRFTLVEALGAKRGSPLLSYYLQPHEMTPIDPTVMHIAIHPGSKEPFRRWPASHFAAVGRALQKEFGCSIYLTGTPSETPLLQEIQKELPSAEIKNNFSSVRHLASFLHNMDLILSNDTGPFHLACALQKPVIGIYVSTDPLLCGPYHAKNAEILTRKRTCASCLKRGCHEPFCFLQIGPKEVLELCMQMLKKNSAFA